MALARAMVRLALLARSSPRRAAHDGLIDMLDELSLAVNARSASDNVKVGVLIDAAARRSYGPLLLFVGLFAISPATILPGMTSLTAIVILLIAVQMGLGVRRPWLPRRVRRFEVPRRLVLDLIAAARPAVGRIDGAWLRPRLEFLLRPPFLPVVALCVALAALVTLPLSFIPLAPLAPSAAIVFFGLAMAARDGLWLAFGLAAGGGAVWLAAPLVF
jgi:hypothetical protein